MHFRPQCAVAGRPMDNDACPFRRTNQYSLLFEYTNIYVWETEQMFILSSRYDDHDGNK